MRIKNRFILVIILTFIASGMRANNIVPNEILLYKVVDGDSLYVHVFKPKISLEPTAAIVFFFGGGWTGGHP